MNNFPPEFEESIKASSTRSGVISLIGAIVAIVGFAAFFIGRFSVETISEVKEEKPVAIEVPAPVTPPSYLECRLPEHGIEAWSEIQKWTANSGWRKGGSSPTEFCGGQKIKREKEFPDRKVTLLSTSEKHQSKYTPFKHDYYQYECIFEDRWNPIYKLRENPQCGRK